MVLNFGKLTLEEEALKEKMAKYKKKKKELTAQKLPKPEKPENTEIQKNPETSTDEQAKILKKLNAMKEEKAKKDKKYKRTKSAKTPTCETPNFNRLSESSPPLPEFQLSRSVDYKSDYYKSFVPEGKKDRNKKRGHTIFVEGAGRDSDDIKNHFGVFGDIVNVKVEADKDRTFITFDNEDSAMEAVNQMDGTQFNGVTLKVQVARIQLPLETFKYDDHPAPPKRSLVDYADDVFA